MNYFNVENSDQFVTQLPFEPFTEIKSLIYYDKQYIIKHFNNHLEIYKILDRSVEWYKNIDIIDLINEFDLSYKMNDIVVIEENIFILISGKGIYEVNMQSVVQSWSLFKKFDKMSIREMDDDSYSVILSDENNFYQLILD